MKIEKACRSCGVPFWVARTNIWRDNGTIYSRMLPEHRMVFLESDNLDGLFSNIEIMVDRPIKDLIIEAKSKATREYLRPLLRGRRGRLVQLIGYRRIGRYVSALASLMGYGQIELLDYSPKFGRAERMTIRVRNIYSLLMFCGDIKGAAEAVGRAHSLRQASVDYLIEKANQYQVTVFVSGKGVQEPEEPEPRAYASKPGNIQLERCPQCGTPAEVASYQWNLALGTISHPKTGRRMAIFGPASIDRTFEELEKQLGIDLDEVIVEAQRRYVHTALTEEESRLDRDSIRLQLAIRGLGNLMEMEQGERGSVSLRIENPCLAPMLIGLMLGGYEIATHRRARAFWKMDEEGDLRLTIEPQEA